MLIGDVDLSSQRFDDGDDPSYLFARSHDVRTGTRRFPADVDDRGPLLNHRKAPLDGLFGLEKAATVTERIGRDIENPHDQTPAGEIQPGPWPLQHPVDGRSRHCWPPTLRPIPRSLRITLPLESSSTTVVF